MKQFMDENFLLSTPTAQKLYHEYAESMPIIDYHCHLSPKEIAENKPFRNITHLMLGGDHYKWRFMASVGVDDKYTRGDGADFDKWMWYAKSISVAIGNPLYHWTHLELKRVFGIDEVLNEKTAPAIWEKANALLATDDYRPRQLIERFNVKVVCTTDDPADDLAYHKMLAADKSFSVRILPSFRPDKAVKITGEGYNEYILKLAKAAEMTITKPEDVVAALAKRAAYFKEVGCCESDHSLETVPYLPVDMKKVTCAFLKAMSGMQPTAEEEEMYRTYIYIELGKIYTELGWAQQYHMNSIRNNNGPIYRKYGADVGFDSVNDSLIAAKLCGLMNAQEELGCLPKTILYTLNPADNYVVATTLGNFQTTAGVKGKIQFGSAWWFCDQKDGMYEHMRTLAALGSLSSFVGMLTDSRSFISYPRHEYFRRILCDLLGSWVENGEFPADWDTLKTIVEGICYNNCKDYFGF